ncbi:hypothetical protein A2U01_0118643, partial [Trifolium medium]|nr:hypothetical protein [Trifolium medium]
ESLSLVDLYCAGGD